MKISAEIVEVKSMGVRVEVRAQGRGVQDPEWESVGVYTFQAPARHAPALHVGRVIDIEITFPSR
jgi:hypothetical protein